MLKSKKSASLIINVLLLLTLAAVLTFNANLQEENEQLQEQLEVFRQENIGLRNEVIIRQDILNQIEARQESEKALELMEGEEE